jgi:AbrB family looped-hinge helix DNA binding protein
MEEDKMTIVDTAKITSKGQVTIPNRIRKFLHLSEGASVAFGLSKRGIILLPCKVSVEFPYTAEEWEKIKRLSSAKGKSYRTAQAAKRHIRAL